jgi:hypothetical protein
VVDFSVDKYIYDHSVQSISTQSFLGRAHHADWDSGPVGYVSVSHARIAEEFGDASPENIERAWGCLEAETCAYDHYLRGECYGFRLYEDGAEIDSCWGFLGDFNEAKAAVAEYLPGQAAELVKDMDYSNPVAEIDEDYEMGDDE